MKNTPCKLCLSKNADKRNSHIIPKFMCKGLFEGTSPRYALSLNRQGKGRKLQDTPKEDFILCTGCEKRIEILETICARMFSELHFYHEFPQKFTISAIDGQKYLNCNEIHPTIFKMLLYSLVWRASISKLPDFTSFNLKSEDEENLRDFLNSNLRNSKEILFQNLCDINDRPDYHSILFKPVEKNESSRGIFSFISMNENSHILILIDFVVLFYTDEESIGNILHRFSNKQNEKVIMILSDTDHWIQFNKIYISKMLHKSPHS